MAKQTYDTLPCPECAGIGEIILPAHYDPETQRLSTQRELCNFCEGEGMVEVASPFQHRDKHDEWT